MDIPLLDEFGNELHDPEYLGDGVYAGLDGFSIWLMCDRWYGTAQVALKPDVRHSLHAYEQRIVAKYNKQATKEK